ncbi:FtsW/RodA/SpoVE family cell cycle protein [Kamptonema cortianum]|nr:FtsW/RodA/SpoVE family cell cycle protein [Kamptonema cortianum]
MPAAIPRPQLTLERTLLVVGGAFVFFNTLTLNTLRGDNSPASWVTFIVWVACAAAGEGWLSRKLPRRDRLLFPLAMFMSGWGLMTIERLTPYFADRQTLWLAVSVLALLVTITLPNVVRLLRGFRYTLLVVGLLLLIGTILLGTNPSGQEGAPQLWLGISGLYFQPSEALKVILVAFLASYLGEQYPTLRFTTGAASGWRFQLSPRIIGPILLMWTICIVVLIWQRDLGAAVLFFMVFLLLLYVASGSLRILLMGGLLIVAAAIVAYSLISLVRLRIDIWLNPFGDPDGRSYQLVQSLMAFGAGGLFGEGLGQGAPYYIPVVHSDFIFASLAEEWGLLGVIVCVACLAALIMRGLKIAIAQTGKPFQALFAVGLSAIIAVQSLLIMGGVMALAPLTGVTLPFFSYGGSSLLTNFVIIGLLLRLSSGEN